MRFGPPDGGSHVRADAASPAPLGRHGAPDRSLLEAQERRLVKLAPHLAPDFDSFQDFVRAVADELGTGLDLTDDSRVLAAWQDAHPDHDEE